MNKHCKGCKFHHAPHPKGSKLHDTKYNDWCCQYGQQAAKVVGHCKLNNGKETK